MEKIERIKEKIKNATGKEKVSLLNDLAFANNQSEPKKCHEIACKALNLAQKINFTRGKARSNNIIGISFHRRGQYDKALEKYSLALKIYQELKDETDKIASLQNNIGALYEKIGNYDKALNYYYKSLKSWEEQNNKDKICSVYNNIGIVFEKLDDFDNAKKYHHESLKLAKKINDTSKMAISFANLGNIYSHQNELDKALEYHLKALKIKKELGNQRSIAISQTSIGNIYLKKEKNKKALDYFQKSKKIFEDIEDKYGIAYSSLQLGQINYLLEKKDTAKDYFKRSLKIFKKIKAKHSLKDVNQTIAQFYENEANYKKALKHYKVFNELQRELLDEKKSQQINELQIKYETEKKEKEKEIFKLKNDELTEEIEKRIKTQQALEKSKLELKKINNKLEIISVTDELTGVYNRRKFNSHLKKEWKRAIREKESISLLIFDIDYFKYFNDTFGHLEGDKLLKKIAQSTKNIFKRPVDLFVRYGGDEFAAILPNTDKKGAQILADECQKCVEDMKISNEASKISDHVTATVGFTTLKPQVGQKLTDLIKFADNALYKAKSEGRNKVKFAND
ncbi:MAG: GGDEF domain-containing protein [Candidatus Cloacimonetes bacterium]|nr:GGDEF domain-containing protein [Candidatus Cloacimonadota bacterium]